MNNSISKQYAEKLLKENILDFWIKYAPDYENGGFYEQISSDLSPDDQGFKGLTLCLRILWTFSAVYRKYNDLRYLQMADRAYNYLLKFFRDRKNGGFYYSVWNDGKVKSKDKSVDLQAFSIYALSEYYLATHNKDSIDLAEAVFNILEKYAHDDVYLGYYDYFSENWENLSLERKSLNTQVHFIEAYTNYYIAAKCEKAAQRLAELLELTDKKILNSENGHLLSEFDRDWNYHSEDYYFGLDIKASWLISRAQDVIKFNGNAYNTLAVKIAGSVLKDGVDENGGLFYKGSGGKILEKERSWWCQAEALVGFVNAYQLTGEKVFFEATDSIFRFIDNYLIDTQNGEWFSGVDENGNVNKEIPKIFSFKCPYHNGRAMMELAERLKKIK